MSSALRAAAPHSAGKAPQVQLPDGSCDCHMHLFDAGLPFAGPTVLKHGDASVDDYRQVQRRLGLERCVIVQPSSYGLDHRALISGLHAFGSRARGVAVVTPDLEDGDFAMLSGQGVVGARFNLVQRGVTDESMIEAVARRIQPLGWHLQVHLFSQDLLRLGDLLVRLPVPVAIDHYARVGSEPGLAILVEQQVGAMLKSGRVWLKLSAPYIASLQTPAFADLSPFVRGLLDRFPHRLLWGTDWPHVTETRKPDDAALLDTFCLWAPDAQQQRAIFVDNPRTLYGF